jgi:hypothetical protein
MPGSKSSNSETVHDNDPADKPQVTPWNTMSGIINSSLVAHHHIGSDAIILLLLLLGVLWIHRIRFGNVWELTSLCRCFVLQLLGGHLLLGGNLRVGREVLAGVDASD